MASARLTQRTLRLTSLYFYILYVFVYAAALLLFIFPLPIPCFLCTHSAHVLFAIQLINFRHFYAFSVLFSFMMCNRLPPTEMWPLSKGQQGLHLLCRPKDQGKTSRLIQQHQQGHAEPVVTNHRQQ